MRKLAGSGATTIWPGASKPRARSSSPRIAPYEATKREHEELVECINATRELWPKYLLDRRSPVPRKNNLMPPGTRRSACWTSSKPAPCGTRRPPRSIGIRSKLHRNRGHGHHHHRLQMPDNRKGITGFVDRQMSLQIGFLIRNPDAFKAETAGLATAMGSATIDPAGDGPPRPHPWAPDATSRTKC